MKVPRPSEPASGGPFQASELTSPPAWVADDRWERRYLLFTVDGSSSGEACYEVPIVEGDVIETGDGRRHLVAAVVDVVGDSRFVGFLMVQPA